MREEARKLLLEGALIPAMPLVLNENRQLDEPRQRRLIRYYLEAGVDGLAVGVHTTQFQIRSPKVQLFERVLQTAMEEITAFKRKTGKPILAVAGACGPTEQAVNEAATAKRMGYDAVLLSPGGLNAQTEEYLLERTQKVAQIMDVIGFYLQKSVGGRVFSAQYWQRLCEIEGVAAVKCAAFNRYLTIDVARAVAFSGRPIALYTGNDDNIIVDLLTKYTFKQNGKTYSVKTSGGLLGHYAVWTHTAVQMFQKIKAVKDTPIDADLLTLSAQVTDANGAFFDVRNDFQGCIAGIHEVLRRQGLIKGIWCLDENEGLSKGQAQEIDRVYAMYPELNDDAFVKEFLNGEGV